MNFSDEILEKIFVHPEARKIPVGCQSTMVHVIEEIISGIKEENPYADLSALFSATSTAYNDESVSEF